MAKFNELDRFIVERGGVTHSAYYSDFLESLSEDLVPESLEFKGSIIVQDTVDALGDTVPGNTQEYEGVIVKQDGPGNPRTPPDINSGEPQVGDFYVVTYVEALNDSVTAELDWNLYQTPDAGSVLTVRPGSMVAWGGNFWNIIGQVDTEPLVQNLQSVTTYGNRTNRGMILDQNPTGMGVGQGIAVGLAQDQTGALLVANGGEVTCQKLFTMNIDFDMFADLPIVSLPSPDDPMGP